MSVDVNGWQANECRNPMNARSASTSIAMGLAMTTLQLFAFPFSGACFNPFKARVPRPATRS